MSFQHLDMVAEKNLEKYLESLKEKRKHYYEIYERCWHLDRRSHDREERRKAERARQAVFQQKMKDIQDRAAAAMAASQNI